MFYYRSRRRGWRSLLGKTYRFVQLIPSSSKQNCYTLLYCYKKNPYTIYHNTIYFRYLEMFTPWTNILSWCLASATTEMVRTRSSGRVPQIDQDPKDLLYRTSMERKLHINMILFLNLRLQKILFLVQNQHSRTVLQQRLHTPFVGQQKAHRNQVVGHLRSEQPEQLWRYLYTRGVWATNAPEGRKFLEEGAWRPEWSDRDFGLENDQDSGFLLRRSGWSGAFLGGCRTTAEWQGTEDSGRAGIVSVRGAYLLSR